MHDDTDRNLFGRSPDNLESLASALGMPRFRGRQLAEWLYRRHARSFEEMTSLSKADRALLEQRYALRHAEPLRRRQSADGTVKYAFPAVPAGNGARLTIVETTVIPAADRMTLCLSTQLGCARGCPICATGRLGFHGNLGSGEILTQYECLPERREITNIVYMGMGEPLDNLEAVLESLAVLTDSRGYGVSPRRITVSTIGIAGRLERLLAESDVHVAVSLHSPFPAERAELIPAERRHPIEQTVETLRRFDWSGRRRVSFEYALIGGKNDTKAHAKAVARLAARLGARVNLIPVNAAGTTAGGFSPPKRERIDAFKSALEAAGVRATERTPRGADIDAACGLLAGRS
ncbi:MAG: 23S rRNA (adenine(2503)-C(2))-methyltransferase RlmN [Spirochaetaceae bacterium]